MSPRTKGLVLRRIAPIEEAPLQPEEVPVREPGRGEILVRVMACGICRTDLHIIEGELPPKRSPLVPGHQIVGVVEKAGEDVARFREGDLVGAGWLYSACLSCQTCLQGRENLCDQARFTGYDFNGGFAQHVLLLQDFVHPIPAGFTPQHAAPLLCAGTIGLRALKLSQAQGGQRLGLFGFGASAHIVIQIAVHWGCEVYVFTRSQVHQNLARRLGAAWTGQAREDPPRKLHNAIIFAPAGELVPRALELLEKGATLALAGVFMTPVPSLDYSLHLYHEKQIRSVANATRQDGHDLLRLAAEIPIRTDVQAFPLEEANRALLLLKQGTISGAGVLEVTR